MGNNFHKKGKYKTTGKGETKQEILDLLTDVGEEGIFQAEIPGQLTLSTTYVSMLLKELEMESKIIKRKEIGNVNRIWLFNNAPKEESIRKLDKKTHLYPVYLGFVPAAEYAALFFAENTVFKKYDIDLKLIQFQNVEEATFALGKGNLDLCVTPVITQIAVALRTDSLRIIAGAGREGSALMIRNDLFGKSICNVDDLKGKIIGSSKLSAMEMNLRTILENNGLDSYADCNIIFYNSPEVMCHALKTGKIDAVSIWEPYITKLESENLGKVLLWYSESFPELPCCTLAANANFLEGNAWLMDKFMNGYIEAFEQIAKNRDKAIKCVANKLKTNERLVRKGYDHFIYSPFISEKDINAVVRYYHLRLIDEKEIRKILSF